ncbi:FYVE zinc finger-domain-containing protein [Xylariales sp. PMI_506]|nr:FYVE zinc finger-domain-containing protein [Xylariales sp. PMI_506]
MATLEGQGSPSHIPDHEDDYEHDESIDTESGSSHIGSAAPDTPPCPFRTSQFHDHECSRYLDCPTHFTERSIVDNATDNDEDQGDHIADEAEIVVEEEMVEQPPPPSRTQEEDDPIITSSHAPSQLEETAIVPTEGSAPEIESSGTESSEMDTAVESSSREPSVDVAANVSTPSLGMNLREALLAPDDSYTREDGTDDAEDTEDTSDVSTPVPASEAESPAPPPRLPEEPRLSEPSQAEDDVQRQTSSAGATAVARPRRLESDITLPRWQPDEEVTYCPICLSQFSFFVRKHHCRKCGRVVCSQCSPHRITIPYQYIVRPPGEAALRRTSGLWGEERSLADFSRLGGGEQVRLCNPCVPDPNTTPPQALPSPTMSPPYIPRRSSHQRSQSTADGPTPSRNDAAWYAPPVPTQTRPRNDTSSRSRSATLNSNMTPNFAGPSQQRGGPFAAGGYPYNGPVPGASSSALFPPASYGAYPPSYLQQPSASRGVGRSGRIASPRFGLEGGPQQFQSMLREMSLGGPTSHASSSSAAAFDNRPLPPPPQPPQIPEEDECPVCHYELPSRSLPEFEKLREEHITACIIEHSTYSPQPTTPGEAGLRGTPPPRTARRTGMFPYVATEKDCVDSAECTICLEEYEAGDKMARLECLCRFHHHCISGWFEKHPGRCPVHQHDSYGY